MDPLVCIVNPKSAGGRTEARWPEVARKLEGAGLACEVRLTGGPGDGSRQAAEALRGGATTVVAVGGDGTIHEVVNGFFEGGAPLNPAARLGILPAGSGSDLIKTLGIPRDDAGAIAALARNRASAVDLGRVTFLDAAGAPASRLFINTASAGMSGATLQAMARLPHFLPATAAYALASIEAVLTFRPFDAVVRVDGETVATEPAVMVVVGNGRYFGSGMQVLPTAAMDDGALDVLIVRARPLPELLANFPRLYMGTHLRHPGVIHARGRRVTIEAERAVPVEIDGEQPGTTTMTIEVLPGALSVLS